MIYYNNNKINKAYKGTSIINKMDDYFGGGTPTPIPDSYVIPFEDSNVKTLCVNNWGGNVVSGELTYGEAKAVTSLGSVFRGNRNIIKFNELVYFTSLSTLDNGEFAGCTNLTDIVIPSNVTYIGDVPNAPSRAPFSGCSNLSGLTILSGEETLEVHMFSFNGSYWMNSAHQSTPMIFPNRSITFSDGGFAYCDYLTTAYFQSITPPIGLADADISNYRKLSTVYCPIGSYDAYYAVLNPKGKTVIEYNYEADPNNVLAREKEWSGKTESGTTSETKVVFQYITDGGEEPTPPTSRLPQGYTEVEYIENTSSAYTETDYYPTQNTRVVAEMQGTDITNNPRMFGAGSWNGLAFIANVERLTSSYVYYFKYGNTSTWYHTNVQADTSKHKFDLNKNQYYIDDVLAGTAATTSFTMTYHLGIFNAPNKTSGNGSFNNEEAFKGKCYSFKVYESDVLVRDLVPCINPSNVVGFYDVVNDTFYGSKNSVTYIAGNPI